MIEVENANIQIYKSVKLKYKSEKLLSLIF